ncbi:MAG: RNA polymerase sigma factor [Oscillospiraceae bacterium]|jgi:RNA polymerase sigma factor (sigma-70 family)|nr:RNA polymerase sigma factor [Oscillospiraceae bacterium]
MAQSWKDWIAALYRQSYLRLYRVAYRLTGSMETAEELTQDTFLWALLHGEELMTHPKPEAWLMRTLTNLVRNEIRRLASTEISLETLIPIPTPEEDRGLVELLPAQLVEEDRKVLILRFEQRLDYREIADRLGISETGCRSRVFRALERCRRLLGST